MLTLSRRYKPYRLTQANTTNHIIAQQWFTELQKKLRERSSNNARRDGTAAGWSSEKNLSNGVEKSFRRSAAAALGEMGQPQAARSREERQQFVVLLGWVSILVNLSHIHSLSNQFQ